jgi:hypothetical protein
MARDPRITLRPGIRRAVHQRVCGSRAGFAPNPVRVWIPGIACGQKDCDDATTALDVVKDVWVEKEEIIVFVCDECERSTQRALTR